MKSNNKNSSISDFNWMDKSDFNNILKINTSQNYFSKVWDFVLDDVIVPQKILDIGCGTGTFSVYPKLKFPEVELYGVDGSDFALNQAKKYKLFKDLQKINDFSLEKINLESNSFDFILCKDLLEHLISPKKVVNEIHRLLKDDGYCLIHIPNHFSFYGRMKFLIKNNIDTFGYFPSAKTWEYPHIRFFTKESLLELLEESNLFLVNELSSFFTSFPFQSRLPFGVGNWIANKLAKTNSTQFAGAFTLLIKKKLI